MGFWAKNDRRYMRTVNGGSYMYLAAIMLRDSALEVNEEGEYE